MGNYYVTNALDDGSQGSLRWAIEQANQDSSADTITFDSYFSTPKTITLSGNELEITSNIYIDGPGANLLTISGNKESRVLEIDKADSDIVYVTIEGVTIQDGLVRGDNGGGILLNDPQNVLTILNSTITGNTADQRSFQGGYGGGIYTDPGTTLIIDNSTIGDNFAYFGGGGIFSLERTVINNSTISANTAYHDGAGIFGANDGIITNTTISYNVTKGYYKTGFGGGIEGANNALIINSTITHNKADQSGGGIYGANNATILNTIISYNQAGFRGQGIYGADLADIGNSIISGNTGSNSNNIDIYHNIYDQPGNQRVQSRGYNIIGTANNYTGFIDSDRTGVIDPQINLGPLQNNGGSTNTRALLPGSIAIDKGDNNFIPSATTDDQRGAGFPRIVNNIVDIGAFEYQNPSVSTTLLNNLLPTNTPSGTFIGNLQTQESSMITSSVSTPKYVYSLVEGEGSEHNQWFQIIDNAVYAKQDLNLDDTENLNIRVQATNQHNKSFETQLILNVIEPDELVRGFHHLLGSLDNEELVGTSEKDRLLGGHGNDQLRGNEGYDRLLGHHGDDFLWGGTGNDVILGGQGNDKLWGGQGSDRLTGNSGADTFVITKSPAMDTIIDFSQGEDVIALEGLSLDAISLRIDSSQNHTEILNNNAEILAIVTNNLTLDLEQDFLVS